MFRLKWKYMWTDSIAVYLYLFYAHTRADMHGIMWVHIYLGQIDREVYTIIPTVSTKRAAIWNSFDIRWHKTLTLPTFIAEHASVHSLKLRTGLSAVFKIVKVEPRNDDIDHGYDDAGDVIVHPISRRHSIAMLILNICDGRIQF